MVSLVYYFKILGLDLKYLNVVFVQMKKKGCYVQELKCEYFKKITEMKTNFKYEGLKTSSTHGKISNKNKYI